MKMFLEVVPFAMMYVRRDVYGGSAVVLSPPNSALTEFHKRKKLTYAIPHQIEERKNNGGGYAKSKQCYSNSNSPVSNSVDVVM